MRWELLVLLEPLPRNSDQLLSVVLHLAQRDLLPPMVHPLLSA
jgi:hypothetical protein